MKTLHAAGVRTVDGEFEAVVGDDVGKEAFITAHEASAQVRLEANPYRSD